VAPAREEPKVDCLHKSQGADTGKRTSAQERPMCLKNHPARGCRPHTDTHRPAHFASSFGGGRGTTSQEKQKKRGRLGGGETGHIRVKNPARAKTSPPRRSQGGEKKNPMQHFKKRQVFCIRGRNISASKSLDPPGSAEIAAKMHRK